MKRSLNGHPLKTREQYNGNGIAKFKEILMDTTIMAIVIGLILLGSVQLQQ